MRPSEHGLTASPQPGLVHEQRRVEQTSAVLAYPGVGVFDDRRYPMGLLSLVVGGGMSSRLFVEVRERRGLTYGIDAGDTSYSDDGLWSVDWQCAPDKLAEILTLVRQILTDVAVSGIYYAVQHAMSLEHIQQYVAEDEAELNEPDALNLPG